MKLQLENYLKTNFPKSDLDAGSFLEVVFEPMVSVNLDLTNRDNTPEMQYNALCRATDVFYDVFKSNESTVWVLINEWKTNISDYLIEQFQNLSENSHSWVSFDQHTSRDRTQVFLIKERNEINYLKIFQAIINGDNKKQPMIKDRIYFINPATDIIFHFWDGCIYLGSKDTKQMELIDKKYNAKIDA